MPVLAQIDTGVKVASESLAGIAQTGGAVAVLSMACVTLCGVCVWLWKALDKANLALLASKDAIHGVEKEHSKKIEELLKEGAENIKDNTELMRESKGLFQAILDRLQGVRP